MNYRTIDAQRKAVKKLNLDEVCQGLRDKGYSVRFYTMSAAGHLIYQVISDAKGHALRDEAGMRNLLAGRHDPFFNNLA